MIEDDGTIHKRHVEVLDRRMERFCNELSKSDGLIWCLFGIGNAAEGVLNVGYGCLHGS